MILVLLFSGNALTVMVRLKVELSSLKVTMDVKPLKFVMSSGRKIAVSFIFQIVRSPCARQWKVTMASMGAVWFLGPFSITAAVQINEIIIHHDVE